DRGEGELGELSGGNSLHPLVAPAGRSANVSFARASSWVLLPAERSSIVEEREKALTTFVLPWAYDAVTWPCGQNPGRNPEGRQRASALKTMEPRRTELQCRASTLT